MVYTRACPMCMAPDGYGNISRTYRSSASGRLPAEKVRASVQRLCQRDSIDCGS